MEEIYIFWFEKGRFFSCYSNFSATLKSSSMPHSNDPAQSITCIRLEFEKLERTSNDMSRLYRLKIFQPQMLLLSLLYFVFSSSNAIKTVFTLKIFHCAQMSAHRDPYTHTHRFTHITYTHKPIDSVTNIVTKSPYNEWMTSAYWLTNTCILRQSSHFRIFHFIRSFSRFVRKNSEKRRRIQNSL